MLTSNISDKTTPQDMTFENKTVYVLRVDHDNGYRFLLSDGVHQFQAKLRQSVIGDLYDNLAGAFVSISGQYSTDEKNDLCVISNYSLKVLYRTQSSKSFIENLLVTSDLDSLIELCRLVDDIQVPALNKFMCDVFSDNEIGKGFVSQTASVVHHHHGKGQLLIHSLECAKLVHGIQSLLNNVSERERELMIIGALLHDVGKIRKYSRARYLGLFFYSICTGTEHEKLSLQLLSPYLETLRAHDTRYVDAIVEMLTWHSGKALFFGTRLVKMADQISTFMNLMRHMFCRYSRDRSWIEIPRFKEKFLRFPDQLPVTGKI